MHLLSFRGYDFECRTKESKSRTSVLAGTTTTPSSVVKKRVRIGAHQTNTDGQDHQRVNRFRTAISRASRSKSMSGSPERRNKNWFHRVFAKSSSSKHLDSIVPMAIDDKQSIDNNTPTTCGNTASDETLSQEGASDEPFQSDIILGHRTLSGRQAILLMSYSSDEEPDMFQAKDDVDAGTVRDKLPQTSSHGHELDISLILEQQSDERGKNEESKNFEGDEVKEDDDDDKDEEFVPKFDRQEVISALFPNGHPDEKPKRRPVSSPSQVISNDKLAALRHFLRQRKDVLSNVGKIVLKPTCDLESVESPIQQSSTSGSSAYSHVTLDRSFKETPDRIDNTYDDRGTRIAADKFDMIGMEITWDPTWELLTTSDSPIAASKTKLRTLQDPETTASSLLGFVEEEDTSADSVNLLGHLDIPSPSERTLWHKSDNLFELGFHFDPLHFPSSCEVEREIMFEVDMDKDAVLVDERAFKAARETTIDHNFESSVLWTNDVMYAGSVDKRESEKGHHQDLMVHQTSILPWKEGPVRSSQSHSDDNSHDAFSNGTEASAVVENLVGFCTKE
jgi:hypothetical protein